MSSPLGKRTKRTTSTYIGFITLPLIAATLPFLVLTGLGSAFLPLMSQAMEDPGYDGLFRPALTLHNMAEGASALGIALKTKNVELKSTCYSTGVASILRVKAYVMGYSTILALPIYEDTIVGMAIAIAVTIVVSAIASFILWDDRRLEKMS